MRKALKEIIDTAEERSVGYFDLLMFVSNGIYNGFWGKNGYDKILILGYVRSELKWFIISRDDDVFSIYQLNGTFNLDINSEYGVPTIWFNKPVYIDDSMHLSSVIGELREEKKCENCANCSPWDGYCGLGFNEEARDRGVCERWESK